MKRTGVILAAGLGARLGESTGNHQIVKPLTEVDGLMLLMHTINSLEIADCCNIVIVLGYQAQRIKNYITPHYTGQACIEFTVNQKYQLQNGISVLCAWPHVGDEFILTMADHILDDEIMKLVRHHKPPKGGAALCVDYKIDTIFDFEDATKVLANGKRIKKIGKYLEKYNCIDTGVFIGTDGLIDAINQLYKKKGDVSLSEGVQLLANQGRMGVIDIKDAFWQDVDNKEMLLHAEKLLRLKSKDL